MAAVPLFTKFPCKTLVPTSSNSKLQSKSPTLVPANPINRRSEVRTTVHRPDFKVRVSDVNDERGPDASERVAEEAIESVEETERLKRLLADSLYGTDRGLSASSETRAEICELITQLESKNPNRSSVSP